ncbi:MAG: BON domain-containing protein [Pseudomonadales bacterium]
MSAQTTRAAIDDALQADPRVHIDELVINQSGDDGRITVEGLVDDIQAKRLAINAVWGVVKRDHPIVDRLRVRAAPEGESEFRAELEKTLGTEGMFANHTLVLEAAGERQLLHDSGADAPRIEARISGPVVTLEGTVPSLSHLRFAEVLCWWAPGCERVDNHLQVDPPEEDSDEELVDVIRMVLEKDPLVDATQLRVGCAGGFVELRGLVVREEQRQLAVLDSWYVPGVWSVVDHIDVRS